MHLYTTTVPTPVGPFTLLVDGDGVCAAGFTVLHEVPLENWGIRGGTPASDVDLGFEVGV
jgi:hypothetical protein